VISDLNQNALQKSGSSGLNGYLHGTDSVECIYVANVLKLTRSMQSKSNEMLCGLD